MEELQLAEQAKNGNAEAFGTLYDRYFNRIYRFIYLKVTNTADAEDLTHQVFLKSWKNIKRFQARKGIPFSSWLYRIAVNAVIDFYRTSRKETDIELADKQGVLREDPGYAERMDMEIEMEQVRGALQKLDSVEQDILLMRFVDRLSNREVAAALQKSEGAVRVLQHRALKKLRNLLLDVRENHNTIKEAEKY